VSFLFLWSGAAGLPLVRLCRVIRLTVARPPRRSGSGAVFVRDETLRRRTELGD
jgi:hypothetical protein